MLNKNITFLILLFCLLNCSSTAFAQVFSNELHYDNLGLDVNEKVELAGPTGTNLTGWSFVLYDGSGGGTYGSTVNLTATLSNPCSGIGFYVIDIIAATGSAMQNGGVSPDGWALMHNGAVVEFFSYEGSFTATSGPANGMTSTDILLSEDDNSTATGSIQRTALTTWVKNTSSNTFGACNTPTQIVPIELLQFNVNHNEEGILLSWATASERNNAFFSIERSADGNIYESIGTKDGAGNSSTVERYTFTDETPLTGNNYYRLQQVDEDGNFAYSPVRFVRYGQTNQASVSPNPAAAGTVNLQYASTFEGVLSIAVTDGFGRAFIQQSIDVNKGENQIPVSTSGLSGGVYWMKITASEETQVIPLIIK